MNIIILGKTNVGKTPFVQLLKNSLKQDCNIISASKWVKDIYKRPKSIMSKEEYVKNISEFSIQKLKENKDLDYNAILNSLKKGINIIDGIRNPYTFNKIFNPNEDVVIVINRINDTREFSTFDKGVDVIKYNVNWLISVGLMDLRNLKTINYLESIEDEFKIEDIVKGI